MNVHQLKHEYIPDDAIIVCLDEGHQLRPAVVDLRYVFRLSGGRLELAGSKPVPEGATILRALVFSPS